jgi:hypothetical protein
MLIQVGFTVTLRKIIRHSESSQQFLYFLYLNYMHPEYYYFNILLLRVI